jgi:hypothetical protein
MKKVIYLVQFDWSTTDDGGIDLYAFDNYDKAYEKFKELICAERNPNVSWVGDIEFDDDGEPVGDDYEFECEDNNSCESEVYWHISDRWNYYRHTFIDLLVLEVN